MTNHRRGFFTKDDAVRYQVIRSTTEPVTDKDGDIWVTDRYTRAMGKVYAYEYQAKSKVGNRRSYWGSYIGA